MGRIIITQKERQQCIIVLYIIACFVAVLMYFVHPIFYIIYYFEFIAIMILMSAKIYPDRIVHILRGW